MDGGALTDGGVLTDFGGALTDGGVLTDFGGALTDGGVLGETLAEVGPPAIHPA